MKWRHLLESYMNHLMLSGFWTYSIKKSFEVLNFRKEFFRIFHSFDFSMKINQIMEKLFRVIQFVLKDMCWLHLAHIQSLSFANFVFLT